MIEPVVLSYPRGDDPPKATLYYGQDCRESLKQLPAQSVHMIATSPPYWSLRDYKNDPTIWGGVPSCDHEWGEEIQGSNRGGSGTPTDKNNRGEAYARGMHKGQWCQKCGAWQGQLGLEPTPEMFVSHLVEIFREAKRVLRDDGTLWINLGDSFYGGGSTTEYGQDSSNFLDKSTIQGTYTEGMTSRPLKPHKHPTLKTKDLCLIPARVAIALQDDGWYVRSDIIWEKKNPMPSSVTDRPTTAHEYIFLLTKKPSYFYDSEAIKEPTVGSLPHDPTDGKYESPGQPVHTGTRKDLPGPTYSRHRSSVPGGQDLRANPTSTRNKRTVWTVNTKGYAGAHFACWPEALVEPMIKAGTSEQGCCSKCGSPYERIVEREWSKSTKLSYKGSGEGHWQGLQPTGRLGGFVGGSTDTTGWQATCTCQGAERAPCVVLDPFSGSATTGLVAMKLGRDYIGLDANVKYLELARARVQERAAPVEAKVASEGSILDIFGS